MVATHDGRKLEAYHMIGQMISHYKILEKLGEGGMGIVYKARDTKLDRDVALKFLPAELTKDPNARERFVHEAKAASALSHPNVCTIHDIQEHDNQMFIVMDFIDGQTLREKKGTISFKQAIEIGIQIADGLAAAHERGIVHRDIKPENIMVRRDGIVQIMDFGLAKLRGNITRLTKEGSTVGTAGYMSPEQVEGKESDHRSDIFSFGVLLYEMLTGEMPFKGVHETALLYEIVNVDAAPMSSIKPEIDPALDTIVLDCLEKDPRERCQSVAEVGRALRRFKRESSRQHVSRVARAQIMSQPSSFQPSETPAKPFHDRTWKLATLFFSLTTIALILYFYFGHTSLIRPSLRAVIPLPENSVLSTDLGGNQIALSPDGSKIAFVAVDSAGGRNLWVRPLNALSAQMLGGTNGATSPFWSPDGGEIGFFADGKLKKIDAAGETPFTICNVPSPRGGSWGKGGVIVFAPDQNTGIYQVSAAGGTPSAVTELDTVRKEDTHRWPWFLPDGKHFLFFIRTAASATSREGDSLCVASIESHTIKHLLHGESDVAYANGHLLFMRESVLMAQSFDESNFNVRGEPVPVVQQIQYSGRFSRATFSVSQNGVLVYQTIGQSSSQELVLLDSSGKKIDSFNHPEFYANARLSGDEKRIAMDFLDNQTRNVDIWLEEIGRGITTRFTFDPATDAVPLWSPDGEHVVFSSNRKGHLDLYMKTTTGSAPEELLTEAGTRDEIARDWSSDGKYILFWVSGDPKTKSELWILPMTGERKPIPLIKSEFDVWNGTFSPDMHWIAYVSNESGKNEVYVIPFTEPGSQSTSGISGKWQVSVNGGDGPRWRNNGKAIFYLNPENKIMQAEVKASDLSFEVLRVTQYMDLSAGQRIGYLDMSSDGKRILGNITAPPAKSPPLILVSNWDAELGKK